MGAGPIASKTKKPGSNAGWKHSENHIMVNPLAFAVPVSLFFVILS